MATTTTKPAAKKLTAATPKPAPAAKPAPKPAPVATTTKVQPDRALGCAERIVAMALATSGALSSVQSLVAETGLVRGQVRGAARSMARKGAVTRDEERDLQKLTAKGEKMLAAVMDNAELPLRLRRKIAAEAAA